MVLPNVRPQGPPLVICKDILMSWYLLTLIIRQKNLQIGQNQDSDPVNQDHSLLCLSEDTRSGQDQNLQIHKQASSKPGEIEVMEWSPIEARDDWVISITEKLEQGHADQDKISSRKLCIYKVPRYLQGNSNRSSYIPQTVSLGPYHHGEEQTRPMECHKWCAVNMLLTRTKQGIKFYINAMRELEEKARACYQGPIGLSSNEFTEMLVLDGCFVLELLRGAHEGFSKLGYGRNDPIFAMRGSLRSIQRDMIMLENQLPLFVLNRLLELQLGTPMQTNFVTQLTIVFFDPLMPTDVIVSSFHPLDDELISRSFHPLADMIELHCLDVYRRSLLQQSRQPELRLQRSRWSREMHTVDKRYQQLIQPLAELRDVGIKFRRRKTDRFWDIRFENGYLEIPKLHLSLTCHVDSSNDITSYIIFMDNLIDSPQDVSYLQYCGIIEHWLGNYSEVADMFNQLCQEVVFDSKNSCLSQMTNEVNRHYNRKWNVLKAVLKWNVWKKNLKQKYFDSPWAYISFLAAVFLLVLTFSQSYFAAYAYYKPPS
ncbi:unnamed protein product [Microthlaspi erraticum]|uniref:Uncharacterized protein n=1 Tax=Microthlaspi erraticum TaxID=1685480 RepID=A0A6D2KUZ8_9BRAS|nr:unnamed protein product [Microthlaspi erraticum]